MFPASRSGVPGGRVTVFGIDNPIFGKIDIRIPGHAPYLLGRPYEHRLDQVALCRFQGAEERIPVAGMDHGPDDRPEGFGFLDQPGKRRPCGAESYPVL